MLVKPLKKLSVVLLVALLAGAAFAGTTGKIAGIITDTQTGEPLPGVNVVISGTSIGAATNIQGEFFIINVPPGKYLLKVNLIGYRPVEVTNVEVTIDLTTKLDLVLETETIDMGTITVEAERPLIEKDLTHSRMRITPLEITNSAVSGLINRVAVNAGNVLGSFRGGRDGTGEVVYLLDGVNMANPLGTYAGVSPGSGESAALATYIPDEAIAEAEVLTGGFGAEYPNVQSAIVNVVAKEGGKTFSGKFKSKASPEVLTGWDYYGDRTYNAVGTPLTLQPVWADSGVISGWNWIDDPIYDEHGRSKIYDMRQHDWSFGGPMPLDKVDMPGEMTFFTSGTYETHRDTRNPEYWRKTQSLQGKLTYNISSSKKLTISGISSYSDNVSYNFPRQQTLTWGRPTSFSGPVYWIDESGWYRPNTISEIANIWFEEHPDQIPDTILTAADTVAYIADYIDSISVFYVETPDGLDSVYLYTPYGWILSSGHNYHQADSLFCRNLNTLLGIPYPYGDSGGYRVSSYPQFLFSDTSFTFNYGGADTTMSFTHEEIWAAVNSAIDSVDASGWARSFTNYNMSRSRFKTESESSDITINFTNNLSPKSFYNLTFSRFYTAKTTRSYDPWDDHPLNYDEMHEPRFMSPRATTNQIFYIDPMYLGRRRTGEDYQIIYSFKGDITSQLDSRNLMKTGFEYKKYNLFKDHTSIASGGNDYNDQFHVKPYQVGVYAQNKLESEGMILNIGLRFDYFDPKSWIPDNLSDPLLQDYLDDPQNIETMFDLPNRLKGAVEAKSKQQLSPRIGISYPITEQDVLHVTYGHYFQLPIFYYMYNNHSYDLRGAHKYMGNPNLKAEKTIAYEAGLEHGFNDYLKFSVVGFFKDISNLINYNKTYFSNAFYWLYSNSDYARVKGFEFTLTQRPWHNLSGVVTYTYQIARGRASDGYQSFQDDYDNRKPRTEDFPLDWDQRHTARTNLNYRVSDDWGPSFGKSHPFGDWGFDFFWTYGSGTPYTGASSVPQPEIPPVNDKTFPAAWRIDLRFDKGFNLYKTLKSNFFVEVRNVTDEANVREAAYDFDTERYELTGEPGGQFADPDAYSAPRRILVGFELVF